jgi:hypothetical protein
MTAELIREELKEIRYYYSRKNMFEEASKEVGAIFVASKIGKYNDAIRFAPPRLYEIYVSLYINNNTFESLADKLGFSYDYIQKLNRKLVKYFQEKIVDKEEVK